MRVLYIDCDTLRPDHLGCYGYHRQTSPNIDRLAAEGMRFNRYYCSDAPCLPSRAALMTGRFGIHSGVVNHGGQHADLRLQGRTRGFKDWTCDHNMPWLFRKADMHVAGISTFAERHAAWWFQSGFHEFHNVGRSGNESAEEVTPLALRWMADHAATDDWFLWLHYWDPHTVYRAPESFGNPFADDEAAPWISDEILARHQQLVGPHCAHEINMYDDTPLPDCPRHVPAIRNRADLKRHFDGYDCGIRYMDEHIGRVLNALADAGVLDDTMIIISADHGENQGELGIYAEHATADDATCRIPMIIRAPGRVAVGQDDQFHYNLDFAPTMAEMMGQQASPWWDGSSYAQTLRDASPCGRDEVVISQCAHVCQRSVRWDRWLYMRTWHDGFHLWPREMLFDLIADPHEQHDIATQRPDIAAEGARRYLAWHDTMMMTQPEDHHQDPLWTVLAEGGPCHARNKIKAHGYEDHLRRTDRAWAIDALKAAHPREFR